MLAWSHKPIQKVYQAELQTCEAIYLLWPPAMLKCKNLVDGGTDQACNLPMGWGVILLGKWTGGGGGGSSQANHYAIARSRERLSTQLKGGPV